MLNAELLMVVKTIQCICMVIISRDEWKCSWYWTRTSEEVFCYSSNLLVERLLVNSPVGCQGLPTFIKTDCSCDLIFFYWTCNLCGPLSASIHFQDPENKIISFIFGTGNVNRTGLKLTKPNPFRWMLWNPLKWTIWDLWIGVGSHDQTLCISGGNGNPQKASLQIRVYICQSRLAMNQSKPGNHDQQQLII